MMATGTPVVSTISNILLGVRDLERSIVFYRDKLGLTLAQKVPGFAFFNAGAVALVLSEPLSKHGEPLAGATEVVFNVDNVTAAYEELFHRGIEFLNTPRQVTPTEWAATCEDPDGHKMTIFGPNPA